MRFAAFQFVLLLTLVVVGTACQNQEAKIEEHLRRAENYRTQEKQSEAIIEYKNVLQLDPNHADAHFGLARAYLSTKQLRQGYWELTETVRLDPSNLQARLQMGQLGNLGGEHEAALKQADAIIAAEPEDAELLVSAHLLRAQVLETLGEPLKAREAYDHALELAPDEMRVLLLLAAYSMRQGDRSTAEPLLRKLVETDPSFTSYAGLAGFLAGDRDSDAEAEAAYREAIERASLEQREVAMRSLAGFYYSRNRFEEAEQTLRTALDEDPGNLDLIYLLARFYRSRGDGERADKMIESAAEARPGEVQPYLILSLYRGRNGDLQGALAAADQALAVDPTSLPARLRKAELLVDLGIRDDDEARLAEGLSVVDAVLAREPDSPEALFVRAKVDVAQDRPQDAILRLRRALDLRPDWPQAHLLLGTALYFEGDRIGSRVELTRAVELDPAFIEARNLLARVQAALGEHALAVEEGRRVLKERPDDYTLRILVSQSLARQQRLDDALRELEMIPEEARDARTLYAFGRLWEYKRDDAKARRFLERAYELDPLNPDVLQALLEVDQREGRIADTVKRIDRALQDKPEDANLVHLKGVSELIGANPIEAERLFRRAIDLDPNNLLFYSSLATVLSVSGRPDETLATYEQALAAKPQEPTLHLIVGSLYEVRGVRDKAIEHYERAIQQDPNLAPAKNNLAYLFAERGEHLDRALDLAQEAKALLPDNAHAADTLGWVLYKKGIPSAAIGYLREAEGGLPQTDLSIGVVRHHLALAYEANDEADKARATLERALSDLEAVRRGRQDSPEPPWASEVRAMLQRLQGGQASATGS